jgi:hypothetical protein
MSRNKSINLSLNGPNNIFWEEESKGVMISSPSLQTSGYEMKLLYLQKNTSYNIGEIKTSVSLLRGKLKTPNLNLKEGDIFSNEKIESLEDSLLFLCQDFGDKKIVKDDLKGLKLNWIEPAKGCYRTDPKIEIDDYKINLWYLVPNKNGGIHNHAVQQDNHNVFEQMNEVHVQLRGSGFMVKYNDQNEKTEYERFEMVEGKTHPLFSTIKNKKISYPWHAYVTGPKGSLFVVFEDFRIK